MEGGEVERTKAGLDRAPPDTVSGFFIGSVAGYRVEVAWKLAVVTLLSLGVWRLWVASNALERQQRAAEVERPVFGGK